MPIELAGIGIGAIVVAGATIFAGVATVFQALKDQELKAEINRQNEIIAQAQTQQTKTASYQLNSFLGSKLLGIPTWMIMTGVTIAGVVGLIILRR